MRLAKLSGWLMVVFGMFILISPFISGFTGFFIKAGTTNIPSHFSLTYFLIGAALSGIGLLIVKPKKKSILE